MPRFTSSQLLRTFLVISWNTHVTVLTKPVTGVPFLATSPQRIVFPSYFPTLFCPYGFCSVITCSGTHKNAKSFSFTTFHKRPFCFNVNRHIRS